MRTALEILGAIAAAAVLLIAWCILRIAAESEQHPPAMRERTSMPPRSRAGSMPDIFDPTTWDD